jgi:dihydropyrimidinase
MSGSELLLIRGGRIVTASDEFDADILVDSGRIALIGESLEGGNAREIDATGLLVLPGCIDPHTHLDAPNAGTVTADDFTTGTAAAVCGGTTTIVDFCFQQHGEPFEESLATWHGKIERTKPHIDVGFHLAITDLEGGGGTAALREVLEGGVTTLKLFMAYRGALMLDDESIFRVMRFAAENGALPLVHAEHGDMIEVLIADALTAGNTGPRYHVLTRPPAAEIEATHRAIQLARVAGSPLYVVHVSCGGSARQVAAARAEGLPVWGETCPQYLFVDDPWCGGDDLAHEDAVKYIFSPPPRSRHGQDDLWGALARDELSVVSTDHSGFRLEQKLAGSTFAEVPNGAPGIGERLKLVHGLGVCEGKIGLSRMVNLLATAPAKLFGLYPRKGTIAVGADADLVLFDPEREDVISAAASPSRSDYSLYEGIRVVGAPETVLLRGRVVVEDGRLVGSPGDGGFVARARFGEQSARLAVG